MAGVRRTADLSHVVGTLRMSDGSNRPPESKDIKAMFFKCRDMPGSIIEWVWVEKTNARTCSLTAKFPYFRDREWWDFERKDDPDWRLFDDRSQGNNVIWEYKTSDLDLVIEIVHMMQTNAKKAADRAARACEASLHAGDSYGPTSTYQTPLFPETLTMSLSDIDPALNVQEILNSLAYNRFNGRVDIANSNQTGCIFFEYGVPIHASLSGTFGDPAVREMVSWVQATKIAYAPNEMPDLRSILRPLDWLMHEGMTLLQQKAMLAGSGLAYESYLLKTGNFGSEQVPPEYVLQRQILDSLDHHRRTLTDVIRDLKPDISDWVPAVCGLMHQRLLTFRPPTETRGVSLDFATNLDEQATLMYSPDTGIYKYEAFLLFLQREYHLAKEEGFPLSLIVLELRNKGDPKKQWLTAETANLIAQRIELIKKPVDIFAHFQMLDYALLMPNTEVDQAIYVARRIISTLLMPNDDYALNITCGLAGIPDNGTSLMELVSSAVEAKEHAKQARIQLHAAKMTLNIAAGDKMVVHAAFRASENPVADEKQSSSISMKDLLIRSGLVSPENYETALALSEKMHMPMARVLSIEGHIHQQTVNAAEHVHAMVAKRELRVPDAIKALKLMGNHGLDIDTALKRLGTVRRVKKHNLGEMLCAAKILSRRKLQQELRQSASAGLPLGYLLLQKAIISQYTLHASLSALRMIKDGILAPKDAVRALKGVHAGTGSLRQYMRENEIDVPEPEMRLGELLIQAHLVSDSELMIAREIELVDHKNIRDVLVECGFINRIMMEIASQLFARLEQGVLSKEQAAQILTNNRDKEEMPDIDKLLSKMAQLQMIQPMSPLADYQHDANKYAAPVAPQAPKAVPANDIDSSPFRESPFENSPFGAPADFAPPPRTYPTHTPSPSASQAEVSSPQPPPPPNPSYSAPPAKPKAGRSEIDRVLLLELAGFIDDKQIKATNRLAVASNIPLIRMLFDTNVIDQPALNLAGAAKRRIESGDIDFDHAVAVMKHCKEKKVTFDEGVQALRGTF